MPDSDVREMRTLPPFVIERPFDETIVCTTSTGGLPADRTQTVEHFGSIDEGNFLTATVTRFSVEGAHA